MGENRLIHVQIDSDSRVVSWSVGSKSIGHNDPSIKEIVIPTGVDEGNFNEYVWQGDNTLLHSPLPIVEPDKVVYLPEIRELRDSKLLESDWRVSVSDYPYSDTDAWLAYRDLLRDYPLTYVPVEFPEWPVSP
tara:strand:- start:584 stop:982 length:399 start_codon:yes stop_codon:yes gene_type:complete